MKNLIILFFYLFVCEIGISQTILTNYISKDGTENINSSDMFRFKGQLYFTANMPGHGYELMYIDSSDNQSKFVAEAVNGPLSGISQRYFLYASNTEFLVYYELLPNGKTEIVITDGINFNERVDARTKSELLDFYISENYLYYLSFDALYVLDLNTFTIKKLKEFNSLTFKSSGIIHNDILYFSLQGSNMLFRAQGAIEECAIIDSTFTSYSEYIVVEDTLFYLGLTKDFSSPSSLTVRALNLTTNEINSFGEITVDQNDFVQSHYHSPAFLNGKIYFSYQSRHFQSGSDYEVFCVDLSSGSVENVFSEKDQVYIFGSALHKEGSEIFFTAGNGSPNRNTYLYSIQEDGKVVNEGLFYVPFLPSNPSSSEYSPMPVEINMNMESLFVFSIATSNFPSYDIQGFRRNQNSFVSIYKGNTSKTLETFKDEIYYAPNDVPEYDIIAIDDIFGTADKTYDVNTLEFGLLNNLRTNTVIGSDLYFICSDENNKYEYCRLKSASNEDEIISDLNADSWEQLEIIYSDEEQILHYFNSGSGGLKLHSFNLSTRTSTQIENPPIFLGAKPSGIIKAFGEILVFTRTFNFETQVFKLKELSLEPLFTIQGSPSNSDLFLTNNHLVIGGYNIYQIDSSLSNLQTVRENAKLKNVVSDHIYYYYTIDTSAYLNVYNTVTFETEELIGISNKFEDQPFFINMFGEKSIYQLTQNPFGSELWITDGTRTGTELIKDINPGENNGVYHTGGLEVDDKFYFTADDGINGNELWVTDKNNETSLLHDVLIGPGSSNAMLGTRSQNQLIGLANVPELGNELITLDSSDNLEIVEWIDGPDGANISLILEAGGNLYALAITEEFGYQFHLINTRTVGTKDPSNISPPVKIFPNPTDYMLFFEKEVNKLEVYDSWGRLIDAQKGLTKTYDSSNLSNGEYFIQFYSNNQKQILKFVKL